jgi:copper(I)-binding protein
MRRNCLIVPVALIALAGCSARPDATPSDSPDAATSTPVDVSTGAPALALADAVVQLPAVPGRPAAAYFVLTVGPDAKGSLVAVSVAHFARAELHQSKMEGGMMTMDPVSALPLTPGKPIVFAPGSYHVMLFDGDGTLKPGDHTALTLTFDNGDKITASAKVTAPGGDDMGGMKM